MFQFSGVNIFPSAIENLIREVDEFSDEYQLIIPKMGSGRHLTIRLEPAADNLSGEKIDQAIRQFIDKVKYQITITPDVEIVEMGTLPRFELKAKRVIREH